MNSPLGQGVLGLTIGDTGTYTAPNGREVQVEIVEIELYSG